MIIDDLNKEEVFDGLMRRCYTLEDLKSIKAQLENNPALLREYALHKKMIQAARRLETDDFRQRLSGYNQEQTGRKTYRGARRAYLYLGAAFVVLLLAIGYFIPKLPIGQPMAERSEISYQEINPGALGAAGTSDTLNLSTVILHYPDDKIRGYAFRGDTLVLYGKFDLRQLRYRLNTKTQERTLFIKDHKKVLDYVVEKKGL